MKSLEQDFTDRLLVWGESHSRQELPWKSANPYHVWLSEIMLQQTQVSSVLGYYARFLTSFPTVQDLAKAEEAMVLKNWEGLGYYSRARNLHRASKIIANEWGEWKMKASDWVKLPGVGLTTANAIVSFCFNEREAILDGNVKRVIARYFGLENPINGKKSDQDIFWAKAGELLPEKQQMPLYSQAIMDLGATVCKPSSPLCNVCPMQDRCLALRKGMVGLLPVKKKIKKTHPNQYSLMLYLYQKGRVGLMLNEQENGVWRQLHTPVMISPPPAFLEFLNTKEVLFLEHKFSHYTLSMLEVRVELEQEEIRSGDYLARIKQAIKEKIGADKFNEDEGQDILGLLDEILQQFDMKKVYFYDEEELLKKALPKPISRFLIQQQKQIKDA